jgi:hypothetical protein
MKTTKLETTKEITKEIKLKCIRNFEPKSINQMTKVMPPMDNYISWKKP